jgi:NAD(P)-dependent dehydrogenase (short-subunit alcohol dehydrogenase family)
MGTELQSKIILVVGGAAGIGRATVELCAERGATVIVADIDEKGGQAAAQAANARFIQVNLSDEDSVKALYAQIDAEHGRLDVLLHCAGILLGAFVPLDDFSSETFHKVWEINTRGTFLSAKYAAPLLRKSEKGVMVLVSSLAATGGSSSFAYGASKGGVHNLGITLAAALAGDNIRVNVLAPGNIDTAMKRSVIEADILRKGTPEQMQQAVTEAKLGEPAGMARVLAWLASDDADYVRGVIATR